MIPEDIAKVYGPASRIKFPGGVVGKVSMVLVVSCVTIGSLAALSKNDWILGGAIAVIFLICFTMLWRLISFANKNPQAALLEGAEFLRHAEIQFAMKDVPILPPAIAEPRPGRSAIGDPKQALLPDIPINPEKGKEPPGNA